MSEVPGAAHPSGLLANVKRARSGCVAAAVAGVVAHAAYMATVQGRFCIDDAYISFRYAQNLADGLGLTFNPGQRVEGYTNFGWVLLLSIASKLGFDLPLAARLLSALATVLLAGLAVRFLFARSVRPAVASAGLAGLMAADGSLARWAQDGLETTCFALFVFLGASLAVREARGGRVFPASALAFAATALVRPEGLLFFAVTLVWSVARRSGEGRWRRALRGALLFAFVYGPYFLWRWHYYGFPLPNTFYAKVGASGAQLLRGSAYLIEFFLVERWPLLLLALAALVLHRVRLAPWQTLFLALAASNASYVLLVGGDWMGTGRFFVPTLALLYAAVAEAVVAALSDRRFEVPVLAAAVVSVFVLGSWRGERISVREERPYLESRAVVGSWLAEHAQPGDNLLASEVGQLAFFSGLPTEDLHGLTDPRIAHIETPSIGRGKPGHEKYDLAYSLGRRPTWICVPSIGLRFDAYRAQYPILEEYRIVQLPEPLPPIYRTLLYRGVDATRL